MPRMTTLAQRRLKNPGPSCWLRELCHTGDVMLSIMAEVDDARSIGRLQVALKACWLKLPTGLSIAEEASLAGIRKYGRGHAVTCAPGPGETTTSIWHTIDSSDQTFEDDRVATSECGFGNAFHLLWTSHNTIYKWVNSSAESVAIELGNDMHENDWWPYIDKTVIFSRQLRAGERVEITIVQAEGEWDIETDEQYDFRLPPRDVAIFDVDPFLSGRQHLFRSIRVTVPRNTAANERWELEYTEDPRPEYVFCEAAWNAPAYVGNHLAFHPGYSPPEICTVSSDRGYLTLRQLWQTIRQCVIRNSQGSDSDSDSDSDSQGFDPTNTSIIRGAFLDNVKRHVDQTRGSRQTVFVENWTGPMSTTPGETDPLREHFSRYGDIDEVFFGRSLPEEIKQRYGIVNGHYTGQDFTIPVQYDPESPLPREMAIAIETRRTKVYGSPPWHDCTECSCGDANRAAGSHARDCLCQSYLGDALGCYRPFDFDKLVCVSFRDRASVVKAVEAGLCSVRKEAGCIAEFDMSTTTIAGQLVRCTCARGMRRDVITGNEFNAIGIAGSQHRVWLMWGT